MKSLYYTLPTTSKASKGIFLYININQRGKKCHFVPNNNTFIPIYPNKAFNRVY